MGRRRGNTLVSPPPAEDILLYDRVANIELENCRQQALLWQVVSPRG